MNELVLQNDFFKPTSTGLLALGNPPFDVWEAYGQKLRFVEGAIQWLIGDWLNYGEWKYGEMYAQAVDETQASTWANYKWVASTVESSTRVELLSWSHHREVADLPIDQQKKYLSLALANHQTVKELHKEIRLYKWRLNHPILNAKGDIKLYKGDMLHIIPSLGRFDLVVTDPPYGVTDYAWDKLATQQWLETISPHLKDKYNLFWFCAPQYMADTECIFRECGLPIQSRIIWHRRNMALGSVARNKFIDTWEMILHVGNRELNFPVEWSEDWFDVQIFPVPQTNFADRKLHPTQKPEGLIKRLVEFGSYPGDCILDPFAGSGTTGVACKSNRGCTLIEQEEEYVKIIEERLGIGRENV